MTFSKFLQETNEFYERYLRQINLVDIGVEGQEKIRNATVTVVGVGGLGSLVAMQLTAMGVGTLRIVDRDTIDISNLHRQYLYDTSLVGYPKIEAAEMKLRKINPDVNIVAIPESLNERNAESVIDGSDVVIDGLDRITPRYILNRATAKLGIPYVFGAAIEMFGSVSTFISGETPCLECIYENLSDEDLPRCSVVGVHPSLLGIVASIEVSEAIRITTRKKPHLAGVLFFIDLRNFDFEKIPISRNQNCSICSGNFEKAQQIEIPEISVECARNGLPVYVIDPKMHKKSINLDEVVLKLRELGINNIKRTKLSVIATREKEIITILRSGITIINGNFNESEALVLYEKLTVYS